MSFLEDAVGTWFLGGFYPGSDDEDGGAEQYAYMAAEDAKKRSRQATQYGQRQYKTGYGEAAAHLAPYDIGAQVMPQYMGMLTGQVSPQDNPYYQAMMDEAISAVNQGAAGSGALYSGARGEALRDAGIGAYTNFMGMMADAAGMGQQTSQQLGGLAYRS